MHSIRSSNNYSRECDKPIHSNAMEWNWSSNKERRVDALALRADERRDKLRKAAGRSTYPLIRGSLNGETCVSKPHAPLTESIG